MISTGTDVAVAHLFHPLGKMQGLIQSETKDLQVVEDTEVHHFRQQGLIQNISQMKKAEILDVEAIDQYHPIVDAEADLQKSQVADHLDLLNGKGKDHQLSLSLLKSHLDAFLLHTPRPEEQNSHLKGSLSC